MKLVKLLSVVGSFAIASAVSAQVFTFNYTANSAIPDGDANGVSFVGNVSGVTWPAASPNTGYSTAAFMEIVGSPIAYNSDYYATLVNNASGQKAVLLNRVGKGEAGFQFGYGDNGMNIKLKDSAANGDIHVYKRVTDPLGGILTGTWQPDGRDVQPESVTTGDARNRTLSQFNGVNPNGNWTLFVADVAGGQGNGTITTWGLEFTAVPEPQAFAMAAGLALMGFGAYRRFAVKKA
jgi:hypothetical protein